MADFQVQEILPVAISRHSFVASAEQEKSFANGPNKKFGIEFYSPLLSIGSGEIFFLRKKEGVREREREREKESERD